MLDRAVVRETEYDDLVWDASFPVYTLDLTGKFIYANQLFRDLMGYAWTDLTALDLVSMAVDPTDDMKAELTRTTVGKFKLTLLSRDGRQVNLGITRIPRLVHGEVIGIHHIATDITAKITTEGEQLRRQLFADSFITHTADAFSVVDLAGVILYVNPAYEAMFGWTAAELVGSLPRPLDERQLTELESCLQIIRGRGQVTGHSVRRRKNGQLIDIEFSLSPVRDEDGLMIGVAAVYRDITDRKKADEIIRRSENLRIAGELAAGVAHEIRNPLTVIKGFVQLLQKRVEHEYMDVILSEVHGIERVIEEFLLLAKPVAVVFQDNDVNLIVQRAVTIIQPYALMHNVQFHLNLKAVPLVACDESQIHQVILNVVKNAVESMATGGGATILTDVQQDGQVLIRVSDEGCGISPDKLTKLGEPFYTTKDKGNGLGLMMSFKIVNQHSGRINFDSELGAGTTVDIVLPSTAAF